jgi:histone acetyltransferase (RNA polymerase elongator complex component)
MPGNLLQVTHLLALLLQACCPDVAAAAWLLVVLMCHHGGCPRSRCMCCDQLTKQMACSINVWKSTLRTV